MVQSSSASVPNFPLEVLRMYWTEAAIIPAEIEVQIIRVIKKAKPDSTKEIKIKGDLVVAEFDYHYRAYQILNTGLLLAARKAAPFSSSIRSSPITFRLWKRQCHSRIGDTASCAFRRDGFRSGANRVNLSWTCPHSNEIYVHDIPLQRLILIGTGGIRDKDLLKKWLTGYGTCSHLCHVANCTRNLRQNLYLLYLPILSQSMPPTLSPSHSSHLLISILSESRSLVATKEQ